MVMSTLQKRTAMTRNNGESTVGGVSRSWSGGLKRHDGIERLQIRLMSLQHLQNRPNKEMHRDGLLLIMDDDC